MYAWRLPLRSASDASDVASISGCTTPPSTGCLPVLQLHPCTSAALGSTVVRIPEQCGGRLRRLIVGVFYLPFVSIFLLRYCTLGSYLTSNVFIPSSLNWTMFRLPEHSGGRVRRSIFDIFCLPFASIFSLRDCTLSSYFLSNIFLLSVYHLTVFYSPEHTVRDVRHLIVGP